MTEQGSEPAAPRIRRARVRSSERVADTTVASDAVAVASDPAAGSGQVVSAPSVSIVQGGADTVHAGSVDVREGGISRAIADDIALSKGGIGVARGGRVSTEFGANGLTVADEARLSQSIGGIVLANDTTLDQSLVRTLVTARATFRQPSGVVVLIAGRTDGQVRPVLDWRGALAAGAAFAVVASILRRRA